MREMDRKALILALLAAALSTTVLSAGAKATSLNITPTIGTYVLSSSASSFFWNYEPMYFESSSSSRAYLKFSISSLYSYYGSGIYSAQLCLFAATHDNGGGNTYGIDNVKLYNNTNQTWGNSTNWNTRIDSGSADTGFTIANFPTGTWRCTDVTNIVKTYLASGYQNATFEFRSPSTASNRTGYPNFMNATHKPYLAISTNGPQAYTNWQGYAYCLNSSINKGENVSCSTTGFFAPANCVNFTGVSVYSNVTTPEFCIGQWKGIYLKEPYPDSVSPHQVSQYVQTSCDQGGFNTTMTNTLVDYYGDLVKAWGECRPYENQSCSIMVNVSASCQVPTPAFSWQFPDTYSFKMNYGEAVNFINTLQMIDNGADCQDITLEVSDQTFGHLANSQDINSVITTLGGATHLPTSYSFDLCSGQGYPFSVYFDPQAYGYNGAVPNSSVMFSVYVKINGTVYSTKTYDINVTGTFIPIGECNHNAVCEFGESNSFCPDDCPNEGQTGVVPCTTTNCTQTTNGSTSPTGQWIQKDKPLIVTNTFLDFLFTPNSLYLIGVAVAMFGVMYALGQVMPTNETVPMFAGAIGFSVFVALGAYYGIVIIWVALILILLAGGFAVMLGKKLIGGG